MLDPPAYAEPCWPQPSGSSGPDHVSLVGLSIVVKTAVTYPRPRCAARHGEVKPSHERVGGRCSGGSCSRPHRTSTTCPRPLAGPSRRNPASTRAVFRPDRGWRRRAGARGATPGCGGAHPLVDARVFALTEAAASSRAASRTAKAPCPAAWPFECGSHRCPLAISHGHRAAVFEVVPVFWTGR